MIWLMQVVVMEGVELGFTRRMWIWGLLEVIVWVSREDFVAISST